MKIPSLPKRPDWMGVEDYAELLELEKRVQVADDIASDLEASARESRTLAEKLCAHLLNRVEELVQHAIPIEEDTCES